MTRIGIELSPVACRIVELDGDQIGSGEMPITQIRSYSILPPSGPETDSRLAALARRPVAVVVWGARADHLQVDVSNASYEKMRAEALSAARTQRVDTQGTLADIAPASTAVKGANRQPVMLTLASGSAVSAAVGSIVAAGARIRSVVTPAEALLGLARSRRAISNPGPEGIEAYIAMDQTATCLALVRDGSLLGACELAWGYAFPDVSALTLRAEPRRDQLAGRLIDELDRFTATVKGASGRVTQVVICGGLSDLRTMTVTLMERLDVEVEPLDSLFGIDADRLPEPSEEFSERASELRLAWAAAADWNGPINLMRYRLRRNRRAVLARAAVVGGIAAGLGAGWGIQRSEWWRSTAPESVARAAAPAALPPGRASTSSGSPASQASAPRPVPSPSAAAPIAAAPLRASAASTTPAGTTSAQIPVRPVPLVPAPPLLPPATASAPPAPTSVAAPVSRSAAPASSSVPTAASRPSTPPPLTSPRPALPAAAASRTATGVASAAAASTPRPTTSTAPSSVVRRGSPQNLGQASTQATAPAAPPRPVQTPAPATPVAPAAVRQAEPVAPARPLDNTSPVLQTEPNAQPVERPPAVAAQRATPPPPIPFDAQLGTILYSAERKLAIINGRIVGIGDEVNGARIVDMTATSVLLRDARNRMRILTVGQATPTPPAR